MPDPRGDLTLLFTALAAACANDVRERLATQGHPEARVVHGYVFQHLLLGPHTITDLATKLGMTQQGASKVTSELARLGYVRRRHDPGDRRTRLVELTPLAHTVIEHGRQARAAVTNELLDHLGPRRDTFLATLVELCEHTNALAELTARRLRPDGSFAFAGEPPRPPTTR